MSSHNLLNGGKNGIPLQTTQQLAATTGSRPSPPPTHVAKQATHIHRTPDMCLALS